MARSDLTWLTLRAGLRDLIIQEHHRPYLFFRKLISLDTQRPQMITLIGQRTKTLVMRKLRFDPHAQDELTGEIHLVGDPDTVQHESPLLFANCELHNRSNEIKAGLDRPPGDIVQRFMKPSRSGQKLDPVTLSHMIYTHLLVPFSTVVCIFAEDFGGLGAVVEVLAVWLTYLSSRPSDLPLETWPKFLVLTRTDNLSAEEEDKATAHFIRELGKETERKNGLLIFGERGKLRKAQVDELLARQFGGLRVVGLPDPRSTRGGWRTLKDRILRASADLQEQRVQSQVAFSARHFKSFFQMASDHFCSNTITPFNFMKASRIPNPVPRELASHLNTFLGQVHREHILSIAVPVIASALAFDAYQLGLHGMNERPIPHPLLTCQAFRPMAVFEQFFYQICVQVDPFRSAQPPSTGSQVASAIGVAFYNFALEHSKVGGGDFSVHQRVLIKFRDCWKDLHSNTTCFSCLARSPENSLSCLHSLCTDCTAAHGSSAAAEPWTFYVKECPLCGEPNHEHFSQKPDTAGVRALIAEGGGIRGIVPLSFLNKLEDAVGLPMDIQDHFDIAFGSSSG
jgi:hypothetical protein